MIAGLKELYELDSAGSACADALAQLVKVAGSLNTGNESEMSGYKTNAAKWAQEMARVLKEAIDMSLGIINDSRVRNG